LVRRLSLCLIRLNRATRLEAAFITEELDSPLSCFEAAETPHLSPIAIDSLVGKFQRYETAIENKLYRAINELERLQHLRRGEDIPAPTNVDLAIHTDPDFLPTETTVASFGNAV
jgi:hypothetical protein